MPTTRGHLGQLPGGGFAIQFSKPGYDVYSAPPEGLVFNSATKRLRPLLQGIVSISGRSSTTAGSVNVNVALPKTFSGLPLIFVDCFIGGNGVKGPGRGWSTLDVGRRDFEVSYYRGRNYFTISTWMLDSATYSYSVFDNEIT